VEIVSRCLAGMNWKTGDAFYALVFNCPLEFTAPVEAMSYVKEINSQFPGALVSVYQNHIVLIARPLDYPLDRDKEKQKLERLLKKSGMRCGVSAVFDDFMGIRHYFVQAAFAAECCKTENRRLGFYQDYYKRHILSSLAKPADLPCFCSPEILSLWKSGKEGQRELARTLHHYLLNGRSIALTAESLHVHRNTLIYRLGRLSDLLGENIKELDADQAFYYLMSCLIVQHL
jgi:sugar diacid utilization regulator